MVGKEISRDKKKKERHQPLAAQIQQDEQTWQEIKPRKKYMKSENEEPEVIEGNLSEKILRRARKQLEEDDEKVQATNNRNSERLELDNKSDEEDDEMMSEDEENYNLEEVEIAEEDEKALELFMSKDNTKRTTLADVIMEKIREKESQNKQEDVSLSSSLDPKVVQVYQGVGELLSRYTAGKVPKAFKIIPALSNWEEILFLTNPEEWTPNAMRVATRVFASNLNAKMAQRFYNLVLLPRVLEDIKRNKKLNFHLYLSLKKALYKPAAFFKGILLPLCESGKCSLREASIIGSVLAKVSIPVLHSSAAILKIAEMEYSGANSFFLKILLNKKYALPYRVINAVVNHFARFLNDPRPLPILWYQALLTFVERYRTDLLPEQKETLKQVIKQKDHFYFTEEIRRQLNNGESRETQSNDMKD